MGFRVWVGLWMAFFLIIIVCFDISAFVKYITRFTGKLKRFCSNFFFIKKNDLKKN